MTDGQLPDLLLSGSRLTGTTDDVLVDLGRLVPGALDEAGWCDHSDRVVVVLRDDSPSVMQVRERSLRLRDRWGDRVRLAVIGGGARRVREIEQFVGIPVVAALPYDPKAAAVATGQPGRSRRLHRAPLVAAAAQLSCRLVDGQTAVARSRSTRSRDCDSEPAVSAECGTSEAEDLQ